MKKFPFELDDMQIEMSPVDLCSQCLVKLALLKDASGYNFHLLNPNPLRFITLSQHLGDCGYLLERVNSQTFSNAIYAEMRAEGFQKNIEISRIFYLLGNPGENERENEYDRQFSMRIDSTFTFEVLNKIGFSWCELDSTYILKMLKHGIEVGYFPDNAYFKNSLKKTRN